MVSFRSVSLILFKQWVVDDDDFVEEEVANEEFEGDVENEYLDVEEDNDTSRFFTTDLTFESKKMVIEWVRKTGRSNGVVVVVLLSDVNDVNRNPRVIFGCERSGKYRAKPVAKEKGKRVVKRRRSSTKKCDCPFRLKAQMVDRDTKTWELDLTNGHHNHELMKSGEGHSFVGRLNEEDKDIVERLGKTGVKSKEILYQIKLNDKTNASTLRTIYNARSLLKIKELCGRTHMQQLFKRLTELGYVTKHRSDPTTNEVQDLFWAYSPSINLAKAFPYVYMLDCTYKTNKYRLPLLEIVGVTSTDKTFALAFCYMHSEKEENYEWALNCLKELFDEEELPGVFVMDRELALLNAVRQVFPLAKRMLCRVHIERNVLSKCIGFFKIKADFDDFMAHFAKLMHSANCLEYDNNMTLLIQKFKAWPAALTFVIESWLCNYKELFVSAWIDQHLHLGNTNTNRVEGSHAKLKRHLTNSVHGFLTSLDSIHLLLEGQLLDIKASFEESLTRVPLRFRNHLYRNLVGVVSTAALVKIESEVVVAQNMGVDPAACNHKNLLTLGLPCAHMIGAYLLDGKSIPISDVHNLWKKLNLNKYVNDSNQVVTIATEMEAINKRFRDATTPQKLELKKQLQVLAEPVLTDALEPKKKVDVRGRKQRAKKPRFTNPVSTKREPSEFEHILENHVFEDLQGTQQSQVGSSMKLKVHRTRKPNTANWVTRFPEFIRPHITHITDVPGDGHCGYRVIANFLGLGDDGWKKERIDLLEELKKHRDEYNKVLSPLTSSDELIDSVDCLDSYADMRHWMTMPNMGNVIASCYNVPVVHISNVQCLTFLPLRDPLPFEASKDILTIGYINGSHFVRVKLVDDSPIPPVSKMWLDHRHTRARHWLTQYTNRIDKFRSIWLQGRQVWPLLRSLTNQVSLSIVNVVNNVLFFFFVFKCGSVLIYIGLGIM
ncbi:uncharacterized protein LOC119987723 [Tripterygium wilfordii]|uniref:uncharacterized protein LOC119987723 n=1 Tax=Tripterygium wilfordii TaxID=458696 RepID=UPI0018F7F912|nr:uncharacterized protein LOC119987723 [Tripterygium wilfordii]